VQDRTKVTINH